MDSNVKRHDALRLMTLVTRQRADTRCKELTESPDLQQKLRGLIHIADGVTTLLLHDVLQHDLLDLAETVLRDLDDQLRVLEKPPPHVFPPRD